MAFRCFFFLLLNCRVKPLKRKTFAQLRTAFFVHDDDNVNATYAIWIWTQSRYKFFDLLFFFPWPIPALYLFYYCPLPTASDHTLLICYIFIEVKKDRKKIRWKIRRSQTHSTVQCERVRYNSRFHCFLFSYVFIPLWMAEGKKTKRSIRIAKRRTIVCI